jgi:hypothetical protein
VLGVLKLLISATFAGEVVERVGLGFISTICAVFGFCVLINFKGALLGYVVCGCQLACTGV